MVDLGVPKTLSLKSFERLLLPNESCARPRLAPLAAYTLASSATPTLSEPWSAVVQSSGHNDAYLLIPTRV